MPPDRARRTRQKAGGRPDGAASGSTNAATDLSSNQPRYTDPAVPLRKSSRIAARPPPASKDGPPVKVYRPCRPRWAGQVTPKGRVSETHQRPRHEDVIRISPSGSDCSLSGKSNKMRGNQLTHMAGRATNDAQVPVLRNELLHSTHTHRSSELTDGVDVR